MLISPVSKRTSRCDPAFQFVSYRKSPTSRFPFHALLIVRARFSVRHSQDDVRFLGLLPVRNRRSRRQEALGLERLMNGEDGRMKGSPSSA